MTQKTYPSSYVHPDPLPWREEWANLTLHAVFSQNASRQPGLTALYRHGTSLTYGELETGSNRIAHALLQKLNPDQKTVALMFGGNVEMACAGFGALKAGRVYAPIEPSFAPEQVAAILHSVGAALFLCDEAHATQAAAYGLPVLSIQSLIQDSSLPDTPPDVPASSQDPATVLFTSGSTGASKGVTRTHAQWLVSNTRDLRDGRFSAGDRLCSLLNPNFTGGQSLMLTALITGITGYFYDIENEGIAHFAAWVAQHHITHLVINPTLFRSLAAHFPPGANFSSVKLVTLGAEKIHPADFDLFKKHFSPGTFLRCSYGTSEIGWVGDLYLTHADILPYSEVPAGYPPAGINVMIMDDQGRLLPPGQHGEIVVRNAKIRKTTYWGLEAASKEKFIPDPQDPDGFVYRTGDVGWLEPDDLLYVVGRLDRQVKIRGMNVNTDDVAAVVSSHPGVRDAAVIAQPDAQDLLRLVAYVVPDGQPPTVASLRAHVAPRLAGYMIPSYFIVLDDIPRLPSGKADLKALPQFDGQRPPLGVDYRPPATDLEKKLVAIWEDTLEVRPIGVDDNFLDLGGDSLDAAQIFVEIDRHLGIALPPASLYSARTVADLTALIERHDPKHNEEISLLPIQAGQGRKPYLFFITPLRGDAMAYQQIISHLDPDLTIYALNTWTMTNRVLLRMSIPEMAAACIEKIYTVDPDGPYVLGGHSFAGLLAFEVAHQIIRQGKPVAFIWMGDTYGPGYAIRNRLVMPGGRLRREVAAMKPIERVRFIVNRLLYPAMYINLVRKKLSQLLRLPALAPNPDVLAGSEFRGKYTPPHLDVSIVQFTATQRDRPAGSDGALGWGRFVSRPITVHSIEGDHMSILQGRGAQDIAAGITRSLAGLPPTGSNTSQ